MGCSIFVVASMASDVDRLLVRSNDFETGRPGVNREHGVRAKWGCERLIARDFGLSDTGKIAGK